MNTYRDVKHVFEGAVHITEWILGQDEAGDPSHSPQFADVSWQAWGVWDGATVVVEGTLETAEPYAQYEQLHTPAESLLTLSDAAGSRFKQSLESPFVSRPRVVGGTVNTALTIRRKGTR